MALPKRKQSKARGRKRRTHYKAAGVSISECPQCSQPKIPHPNCGYYRGRPILSTQE
jgi:large subunit ribosomal protein L32